MDERIELNDLRVLHSYLVKKVSKLEDRLRRMENEEEGEEEEEEPDEEDEDHSKHTVTSESEEEDEIDELPTPIKAPPKFRKSVSAEAYGLYNKKGYFCARTIDKEDETKHKIKQRLLQSFMFSALSENDLEIVVDAMEIKTYNSNDVVIQQDDDGDELFVVGEGKLHCFRTEKGETNLVKTYKPGDYFGELALLYNAPRAATIIAVKDNVILYSLDRLTFNHIVKDSAIKRRQKYEDILKGVKVLDSLDTNERSKLVDALSEEKYSKGDEIIKQGEIGNKFYFIIEGKASARKTVEKGKDPIPVMNYKEGDYFGEVSLMKNQPRAATIIAESDVTTL